jgi:fused-like protein
MLLGRVAIGLDKIISSDNTTNAVDGNSTQEGTIMSQILGQAKNLGTVEQLCLCLTSTGSSLASGSCSSAPVAAEACKAIWNLLKGLNILTVRGHKQSFPLSLLRGNAQSIADGRQNGAESRADSATKVMIEQVIASLLKSRDMNVAICYVLMHGSESGISAVIQVWTLHCARYY